MSWLEPAQASDWESRTMERAEVLALVRNILSETIADANSVEAASEIVVANLWIAEPFAGQWSGRLQSRVDDIQCIRSALSESVVAAELDSASIALEEAAGWLGEATEWREEISRRIEQMELLRKAATANFMSAPMIEQANRVAMQVSWLQEAPVWAGRISERMDTILIVRDQALNGVDVPSASIEVALKLVERSNDWLAECAVWKAQLLRRIEQMSTIKEALKDSNVSAQKVALALPVLEEVQPWLAEAPSWRAQIEQRMKEITQLRAAVADNTAIPAVAVEAAADSEWQLSWLADDENWKATVADRVRKIKVAGVMTNAVATKSTMTARMVEQANEEMEEASTWLAEASRWKTLVHRRMMMVDLLKAAVKPKEVPAGHVTLASQHIEHCCSWLSDAVGWKGQIMRRSEVVAKIKTAITAASVSAQAVEDAAMVVDEAMPWLENAGAYRAEVKRRAELLKFVKAGTAASATSAGAVETAVSTIRYMPWLATRDSLIVELKRRMTMIQALRQALAQQQAASPRQAGSRHAQARSSVTTMLQQELQHLIAANRNWLSVTPTGQVKEGIVTTLEPQQVTQMGDFNPLLHQFRLTAIGITQVESSTYVPLSVDDSQLLDDFDWGGGMGHDSYGRGSTADGMGMDEFGAINPLLKAGSSIPQYRMSSTAPTSNAFDAPYDPFADDPFATESGADSPTPPNNQNQEWEDDTFGDLPILAKNRKMKEDMRRASEAQAMVVVDQNRVFLLAEYKGIIQGIMQDEAASDDERRFAYEQQLKLKITPQEHQQILSELGRTEHEFLVKVSATHRAAAEAEQAHAESKRRLEAKRSEFDAAQGRARNPKTPSVDVEFGAGPLGVLFNPNPHGNGLSAVADHLSGTAARSGKIEVGDVLVAVNRSSTKALDYGSTLALVKSAARPVTLTFEKPDAQKAAKAQAQGEMELLAQEVADLVAANDANAKRAQQQRGKATASEAMHEQEHADIKQVHVHRQTMLSEQSTGDKAGMLTEEASLVRQQAVLRLASAQQQLTKWRNEWTTSRMRMRDLEKQAEALCATAEELEREKMMKSLGSKWKKKKKPSSAEQAAEQEEAAALAAATMEAEAAQGTAEKAEEEYETLVASIGRRVPDLEERVRGMHAEASAIIDEALHAAAMARKHGQDAGADVRPLDRFESYFKWEPPAEEETAIEEEVTEAEEMSMEQKLQEMEAELAATKRKHEQEIAMQQEQAAHAVKEKEKQASKQVEQARGAALAAEKKSIEAQKKQLELERQQVVLERKLTQHIIQPVAIPQIPVKPVDDYKDIADPAATPAQQASAKAAAKAVAKPFTLAGEASVAIQYSASQPLGLELEATPPEMLSLASAAVRQVSGAAAAGGEVFVGDVLVAINGEETKDITFSQTCEFLQAAASGPGPVRLELRRDVYDVLLKSDLSSLMLVKNPSADRSAVVKRYFGSFSSSNKIQAGHLLLAVNHEITADKTFAETKALFDAAKAPVMLRFRRTASMQDAPHRVYMVSFGGADTGLELRANASGAASVEAASGAAGASGWISAGDEVVSVNGEAVDGVTCKQCSALLKRAARPVNLVFRTSQPGQYQVVLQTTGPLGILLGNNPDGSDVSAVVDQVSGPAAESGKIQIGHFLTSVNGQSTLNLNYYQTLTALKNATRPITLGFSRNTGSPTAYDVTLSATGPLGILLGANPSGPDASAVVESVEGPAAASGKIKAGHYLVSVNGESTLNSNYYQTLTKLQSASRPITLHFVTSPPNSAFDVSNIAKALGGVAAAKPKRETYEITIQTSGPLGILLGSNPNHDIDKCAVVDQVSGSAALSGKIEVGHWLVGINGVSTMESSYYQILSMLREGARPIKLKFSMTNPFKTSGATQGSSNEYSVTINERGPLGILLGNNPSGTDVSSVVDQVGGVAAKSGNIKSGHFLIGINKQDVSRTPYEGILALLRKSPRPITLVFSSVNPAAAASSGGSGAASGVQVADYNVVIAKAGPLGMLLSANPVAGKDVSAVVDEVSGLASVSGKIKTGHFLLSVNGQSTTACTYYEVLKMLKSASRPITLEFAAANPATVAQGAAGAGAEYKVVLQTTGPLGILLGNNPDGSDVSAVVDQVSGPAAESGKIQIGHFLTSVNGQSTLNLNYYQTLTALKNATRPITLEFSPLAPGSAPAGAAPAASLAPPPRDGRNHYGDNCYEITLEHGPLGILLTGNPNGPDLAAAVKDVPEQSQAYGKVRPWDYLCRINDVDTCALSFTDTMTALKKARRPVTLGFVSSPRLPTPRKSNGVDAFTVYPTKDPTHKEDTGGVMRGLAERCLVLVGPDGIHIVAPGATTAKDATVAFWKWSALRMHKGQKQSENPDDMELFMFVIEKIGMFIFEVNDHKAIMASFEDAIKRQHKQSVPPAAPAVPVPATIQHTGPRRKKTQAIVPMMLK